MEVWSSPYTWSRRILTYLLDKTSASETLLKALCAPYPSSDPATPHAISLPHTSRIYKMLLQGGHFSHATKTVERASRFSARDFAVRFVQIVGRDSTVAMAQGDGAFVVAALCEQLALHDDIDERKTVRGWFDEQTRKSVEAASPKGVNVLLEGVKKL